MRKFRSVVGLIGTDLQSTIRKDLVKTIRIFISSPGDVQEERERARQVIEGLRRRYAGVFHLKPVLWEELPLQPDMNFQQGIDAALLREGLDIIDIAIFILWSRLGSPTGPLVVRKDGTPYRSGTEREYDLMMSARTRSKEKEGRARPDILVYTRRDEASFDERLRGKSTSEKDKEIRQKKLIETFIAEEFKDAETGSYFGAYHNFDLPTTFSKRLREHLTKLLDELAGAELTETIWEVEKQGPPFLGLASFQPEHADVFFGREDEVLEARRTLAAHALQGCAFLMITGASGTGKSSLARAGLLPAIAEYELDETVTEWRFLIVTPSELGSDPFAALLERLSAPSVLPGIRSEGVAFSEVVDSFRNDASTAIILLKQAIAAASKERRGGVRVILLVDQLEEVFGLSDRTAFLTLIEALTRSGVVWVVATIRGDFLGEAHRDPVLASLMEGRPTLGLLPPDADALRRMIEEPARLAGLVFEERGGRRLGERILADAAKHADLLPLMEFVLLRLYETRDGGNVLSWSVYEEQLGGVEGALRRRADEIYDAFPSEVQASLPQVLKRLVTVPETAEKSEGGANRFIRQWADLDIFPKGSPSRTLVDALIVARLLTAAETSKDVGEGSVTVAHEALLRVWPRASSWADGNRDLLRTRARVAGRMGEGEVIAEGDPLLASARRHLDDDREAFDEVQAAFVEKSVQKAEESRRRRERTRRVVVAGMAVLTLLASGAAAWGWRSQRIARTEAARAIEQGELAIQESKRATQESIRAEEALANAKQQEANVIREKLRAEQALADAKRQLERSTLEEGRAWLERARTAEKEKNPFLAIMLAGRAVGFRGYGWREEDHERYGEDYQALLSKSFDDVSLDSERLIEAEQIRQLIDRQSPTGLLVWSSPLGKSDNDWIWDVAISPDGLNIASGSDNHTVKLWDAVNGKLLTTLAGHLDIVFCVSFSPDGTQLASGAGDSTVKLWDLSSGRELRTLVGHNDSVISIAFSPDGKQICSGDNHGDLKIWDVVNGKELLTLSSHRDTVTKAHYSLDGHTITSGSADGSVKLWDAAGGKELSTISTILPPTGHEETVVSIAISPNGNRIASGSEDGTIKLWNADSGELGLTLKGHVDKVWNLAFNPDGRWLASGAGDGSLKLWDATSGDELATLHGHKDSISGLAFSPDGRRLISGSTDGSVKIWDTTNGIWPVTLSGHTHIIDSLAVSPDGLRLASGSWDATVKLWDVVCNKELATLTGHTGIVNSVAFSPDGLLIASGSDDNTVKLWDVRSGQELLNLSRHGLSVYCVAFSPDGKRIASGARGGALKLWDVASGDQLAQLYAHTDDVVCLAFSPDGRQIASGSRDDTVILWDAASGKYLKTLTGLKESVKSVVYSPDSSRVAARSFENAVKSWNANSGQEVPWSSDFPFGDHDNQTSSDGRLRAVAQGEHIRLDFINSFIPDLMHLQRQSIYQVKGRELRINVNSEPDSDSSPHPAFIRKDEYAELATPELTESRRVQLTLQLLAKGSQWRAAIALWPTIQNAAPEERRSYLTFLLSQALTDLRKNTAPSLPLLLPAITSALDTPTTADPRVSLPLIQVLTHLPNSYHFEPNRTAYEALNKAAFATLPAHLRESVPKLPSGNN